MPRKTPFTDAKTPSPFSRLAKDKLLSGTTGAALYRKIPLIPDATAEAMAVDTHGNFDGISHIELADATTDKVYYNTIVIPSDSVGAGVWKLGYSYSNAGTTGNVLWVVRVVSITAAVKDTSTAEVALLADSTAVAVTGVANTISTRSVSFTVQPSLNTSLAVSIQRTGGDGTDTNSSNTSLWNAWIEYLASS